MVVERIHPHLCNSYEYRELENPGEAKKTQKLLDIRQIGGQEITATIVSSFLALSTPRTIQSSQKNIATTSTVTLDNPK